MKYKKLIFASINIVLLTFIILSLGLYFSFRLNDFNVFLGACALDFLILFNLNLFYKEGVTVGKLTQQ
jgi:hypothetical protein